MAYGHDYGLLQRILGKVRGSTSEKIDALPILDGPRLDKFDVHLLAQAIESEVARAKENGWPKISLHMDLEDAYLLAQVLKRR